MTCFKLERIRLPLTRVIRIQYTETGQIGSFQAPITLTELAQVKIVLTFEIRSIMFS